MFGRLAPPKQRQLIADLLARVAALRQEQQGAPAAAAGQPAAKASVAAVAAEALARLGSLSVSSSAASSEREDSEDELAAPLSEAQRQALGALRELCALQDACDAFLAHVLSSKGGGDVEVRQGSCLGTAVAFWAATTPAQLRCSPTCAAVGGLLCRPCVLHSYSAAVCVSIPSRSCHLEFAGGSGLDAGAARPCGCPGLVAGGTCGAAGRAGSGTGGAGGQQAPNCGPLPAAGGWRPGWGGMAEKCCSQQEGLVWCASF